MSQTATQPPSLISEEYRRMQQQLHDNPDYGVVSVEYAPPVAEVLRQVGMAELPDCGAGKRRLGQSAAVPEQVRSHATSPNQHR